MELFSVLVTGANRGIGLEFVRQLSHLSKPPQYVFATYRSSESLEALTDIKNTSKECRITFIKMDVKVPEEVVAARKIVEQAVGDKGLTLLINNAGVVKRRFFPNLTEENVLTHFTVNTFGPIRVFQEMLPLLQKAACYGAVPSGLRVSRAAVLNMTSFSGSITRTDVALIKDLVGYKISKAALNMAMRVIAANVTEQGILVVNMCPGWVKTDMTAAKADLTKEESISVMLETLEKLNDSHHGSFIDRFGNLFPY